MVSALTSRAIQFFFSILLLAFSFLALPHPAAAVTPNTDPDVPKNSHTYAQTVLIDVLSALSCGIVGIDPTDPGTPCLSVNPETHKIGYTKSEENQLGGMLGIVSDQIGVLYTPAASSGHYVSYLANNFGIVKPAIAADYTKEGVGFNSLQPIFNLWKMTLNIAYLILVLAFIFIGLAVMLRIKIDPRTVMTVQNQIPRVVICILLITLSYGIAGGMIDMMWTGTYVGINAILEGPQDVKIPGCGGGGENAGNAGSEPGGEDDLSDQPTEPVPLSTKATTHLLDTPISYFNQVFHSQDDGKGNCGSLQNGLSGGLFHVTNAVSRGIGGVIRDVITSLMGSKDCSVSKAFLQGITGGLFGSGEVQKCASKVLGEVFRYLANIVSWLIVLVAILISLFRVWFKLLTAYIHIIFYVIAAPIWIAMGLIPGRPLGFENWMRNMTANLLVFPLTAFLFVAARIFMDVFDTLDNTQPDPNNKFIPPLVGNPNMELYGTILAFGIILMAPGLLDLLKEKMKAQGTKLGGLAAATLTAGVGAATAVPKRAWSGLTAKDQYGKATGPVSSMSQAAGRKFVTGKYMPWQLHGTYKKWQEKKASPGKEPTFLSWADTHQQKKDMARTGHGYQSERKYFEQTGEHVAGVHGRPKPQNPPSVTSGGKAGGPRSDDTRTPQTGADRAQAYSDMLGRQQKWPMGGRPMPPRPPQDGPEGPHKPDIGPGGIPHGPRPQNPNAPTGAAKATPGQQGGGTAQAGSAKLSELTVGTLKVGEMTGGGAGKHEPETSKPSAPPTYGQALSKAFGSVKEGVQKGSQAIDESAEHVRATATPPGEIHDARQEAAREERGRAAGAEQVARRISETGHESQGESAAAPQQHGGGTSVEQVRREVEVRTTHTESGEPLTPPPAKRTITSDVDDGHPVAGTGHYEGGTPTKEED